MPAPFADPFSAFAEPVCTLEGAKWMLTAPRWKLTIDRYKLPSDHCHCKLTTADWTFTLVVHKPASFHGKLTNARCKRTDTVCKLTGNDDKPAAT